MILTLLLLVPLAAGLLCWPLRSRTAWERVNLLAGVVVLVLALVLCRQVLAAGAVETAGGLLRADPLSALLTAITAMVAFLCTIYAVGYFRWEGFEGQLALRQVRRYYVLSPLLVGSMLSVGLVNNMGLMWVAAEATTLASVLLVTSDGNKAALEAGWKYIIIGSIGLSLALLGTILTYSAAIGIPGAEKISGLNWSVLVTVADRLNPTAMRLAFVMILMGYGTQAGLAPLHTWKPDAYAEAPVPTASLLGAGVINCAVYGIIRFHLLAVPCLGSAFSSKILIGFGLFSILLAAPFVLAQRNFRRLLAYSSMEHAGLMAMAIGFGGKLGALGLTLHMFYHALSKPLLFFCSGNIQQHFGMPHLQKASGVLRAMPRTGVLFLASALAVAGLPPFGLFQSQLTTVCAGFARHHPWVTSFMVLGVTAIFGGFLLHAVRMILGAPRGDLPPAAECRWKLAALGLGAALMAGSALWLPAPARHLLRQAAAMLAGSP
jgi:hydrogenase-4 component F